MNQLTLQVAEIKKALRPLAGVINSTTILPILEDAHLEIQDTQLKITVTDLETIVSTWVTIPSTKKKFSFCVDFKMFKSLIDRCESTEILLGYSEKAQRVTFDSMEPQFSLTLPAELSENYPLTPVIENPDFDFSIAAADFIPYLKIANTFTSNDDLRPSMTGICMYNHTGRLLLVATDAHRLYKKETMSINKDISGMKYPKPGAQYIIPQKSAKILGELFKSGFTMRGNTNHIECFDDTNKIILRCIDARYPDWETVWPKDSPYSFYAKRKQLKAALVLAQPYTNKSTGQVTFNISKDSMVVATNDVDFSIEFDYKLPIYETGMDADDKFSFALNQKFAFAALQVTKDENVRVRYEGATKAFVIDDDILIMPLMLNN